MTDNPYKINTPGRVVWRAPEPEKVEPEKAVPTKPAKKTGPKKCPNCGREFKHGYTHVKANIHRADGKVTKQCNVVRNTGGGMYAGGRLQNQRVRFVTGRRQGKA
jgi:hypothetical protein